MAMNDRPELSDESIQALLEERAAGAKTDGLLASVRLAAASTPQRRAGRFGFGFVRGSLGGGLAGAAALVLVVIALGFASGGHIPGVASPSDRPSATGSALASPLASGSAEPPATPVAPAAAGPVLPLTVDQVNALMASNPGALNGRQLAITGTISNCRQRGGTCPAVLLAGSQPVLAVVASAAASLPSGLPLQGTFAATLIDARTLQYEGVVKTAAGGGPMTPSQLPAIGTPTGTIAYWLVQGWIAGFDVPLPCPTVAGTPTGPQYYGCAVTSSLSDTSAQPVSGTTSPDYPYLSGAFRVPRDGVQVQDRAYDDFAPNPKLTGHGTEPELATFLVDQVNGPCPPGIFCTLFGGTHWHIVARMDPWPMPGAAATPTPISESPAPSPDPAIAVRPLTVDQLNLFMTMNSQSPSGRQLVITGTIVPNTMAMICVAPCTGWVLEGSDPTLYVQPVGDIGPGPWNQKGAPLTGTFAATMADGFVLDYQGPVSTTPDGGAWQPSQWLVPSAAGAAYRLVHGWIVAGSMAVSCPQPNESPYDGPQYTCAGLDILSDSEFRPSISDPFAIPDDGIRVQNGAYDQFAPAPSSMGAESQPEQATFLIRATYIPPCSPTADCFIPLANYHWQIVARIGPWPFPTQP